MTINQLNYTISNLEAFMNKYKIKVSQSVATWNLVCTYIGSRYHMSLVQRNGKVSPNPRTVEVVTVQFKKI